MLSIAVPLGLDSSVAIVPMSTPIKFETAGGHTLTVNKLVNVKVDVQTISGTISSYKPMACCILDEDEELFLITNNMLKEIGINVDLKSD